MDNREENLTQGAETGGVVNNTASQGAKQYYIPKQKNKSRKGFVVFLVILAAVIVCVFAVDKLAKGDGNDFPNEDFIARFDVTGTIGETTTGYFGNVIGYQHEWTMENIDKLIEDENNKGILVYLNTPGGAVYETDELYLKLEEYKERTGRPVYAYMGKMAASGGYYISAASDKIIANRNTWTGSIGVTLGTMMDFSQLLEKYGIKTNTITSGANKAMGSSYMEMTDEQKAIFQGLVDDAYNRFVKIVADGRKMEIKKAYEIADGRIYTANQAKELGLIDEIGTYEWAENYMKKECGLKDAEIVKLENTETTFLSELFGEVNFKAFQSKSDVAAIVELAQGQNREPISYLCEI